MFEGGRCLTRSVLVPSGSRLVSRLVSSGAPASRVVCIVQYTDGGVTGGGIISGITSRARLVRVAVSGITYTSLSAVYGMAHAGSSGVLIHDEWKGSLPPRRASLPSSRERGEIITAAESNGTRPGGTLPDDISKVEQWAGAGEG